MLIKVRGSRKQLVRCQKSIVDYVHRKDNPYDKNVQGAIQDFQKQTNQSKIFDDKRGQKHIISYEKKEN